MFTGIVEEVGSVESIQPSPNAYRVAVRAQKVLEGTRPRDSIAVNGVCLTVVDLEARTFNVEIMPQTFKKTNLSLLRKGSKVNLRNY